MAAVDANYFTCTLGEATQRIATSSHDPHSAGTVIHLVDEQARLWPRRPALGFASSIPETSSPVVTFQELRDLSRSAAEVLSALIDLPAGAATTVGLLSLSSVDFVSTLLGLMRLGCSVLLLAPQLEPRAIKHLCATLQVTIVLVDEDHLQKGRDLDDGIHVFKIPSYSKHYDSPGVHQHLESPEIPATAYFFHTSGTASGLPKPIAQSHAGVVGALPRFGSTEQAATFSTTPLYHGGLADYLRAWTSGALIWCFAEGYESITTANLIKTIALAREATHVPVSYFSSVPFVLQQLAEEDQGIELLQTMDLVGVGGAPLADSVGDGLVRARVKLLSRMGSAECGFLMSSHREYATDDDWQYLRPVDDTSLLEFEPRENDLYELIVKPQWAFKSKTNRDDGSYATSDLFERHPLKANAWRYHSRADAQITLANGKKFDPSPMEIEIVASTKLLKDVLIFGSGHDYPGILLFPADDELSPESLVNSVWPLIDAVNSATQGHARIPRSMLVVVPFIPGDEVLEKSSKGTILRRQAEQRYADVMRAVYQTPQNESLVTEQITDEDLSSAVLDCFQQVLGRQVDAHDDLYRQGVDSMACIQVRKLIESKCLPPLGGQRLAANIIYDKGTVEELTAFLRRIRSNGGRCNGDVYRGDTGDAWADKAMRELVARHSDFGNQGLASAANTRKGTVVVLTGATGFLGSYMLHQLRQDTRVRRIYCLVRAQTPRAALERVSEALERRGMPGLEQRDNGDGPECSSSHGDVKCLPSDLANHRGLGVPETEWGKVLEEASVVIHAAWTVNFSLRLESFEDQVAGTRNLIDLAMQSGARFFFLSSTAAVSCVARPAVLEQVARDPRDASPLGYSRSKWAAERVCAAAAQQYAGRDPLASPVSIIRIGQLCGDAEGVWNASEAYPLLLSTARVTGCLPDLPGEVLDWMPVDLAARAVLEIALPEAPSPSDTNPEGDGAAQAVFHVLNAHATPTWRQMLEWIAAAEADSPTVRELKPLDRRRVEAMWKWVCTTISGC